jgi:hypothetical protein
MRSLIRLSERRFAACVLVCIGKAEKCVMNNQNGGMAVAFGAFVLLAAILFISTGGSLGGKTTIESDKDLPPVASLTAPGEVGR